MICITKFFKPVSKTPKIDSNEQNTELEQGPDIGLEVIEESNENNENDVNLVLVIFLILSLSWWKNSWKNLLLIDESSIQF